MFFVPDRQYELCQDETMAILSDSPTLTELNATYGKNTAAMFLVPQLFNLSEFCGAKDKFTESQISETALLIATSYPWIKVKEFMVFCKKFKLGQYGQFYGTVDPMVITRAFREFLVYRSDVYADYEEFKAKKAIEEQKKKPTLSYEEWRKEKEAKGEPISFVVERSEDQRVVSYKPKPLETLVDGAKALIENRYNVSVKSLLDMRKMFIEKNGLTPEEVVEKSERNEL